MFILLTTVCQPKNGGATPLSSAFSPSLAALVQGNALTDAWKDFLQQNLQTLYRTASRSDPIYLSRDLMARKLRIETVRLAVTDNLAIVMWLNLNAPILRHSRGT